MENNGIFYTLYLQMNVKNIKFSLEIFGVYWKSAYLCTRFRETSTLGAIRKSSLKDLHNREVVVQEAIEKSIG